MTFLAIYFITLLVLCFYGSHRYKMAYLYRKHKSNPPVTPGEMTQVFETYPKVLVQLPGTQ